MVAGVSFLAAALLFAIRIGLLIILMAFSPVYFVGMILPEIKEKLSDRWKNMLVNQCLIMPIYMFFMYIALRVITNPSFQGSLDPNSTSKGTSLFPVSVVGTAMEYIIALILIIIPMVAALQYASVGSNWANAIIKKGKDFGKGALSSTGKNTIGRAANVAQNSKVVAGITSRVPGLGLALQDRLGKVADSNFGYGKKGYTTDVKNKEKAYTKAYEKQDDLGKAKMLNNLDNSSILKVLRKTPIIGAMFKTAQGNTATKIKSNNMKKKAASDYNTEKSILEDSKTQNNAARGHITLQLNRGTTDSGKPLSAVEINNLKDALKNLQDDDRMLSDELKHAEQSKLIKIKLFQTQKQ